MTCGARTSSGSAGESLRSVAGARRSSSPILTFRSNCFSVFGSNDSIIHKRRDEENRGEHRQRVNPDAGREADRKRAQHHDCVFRVLNFRSIAYQICGADDAERAGETRSDDEHDQRADDRENDLRLDRQASCASVSLCGADAARAPCRGVPRAASRIIASSISWRGCGP